MGRRQRGEGSIHQRADGLWVVQVDVGTVGGKRKRRTVYAKTQREAVKKADTLKAEVKAGQVATAGMTVEAWLNQWLDTQVDPRLKPKTARTYRSYVEKWLIPTLGKKRLDKLSPMHVREMHAVVLASSSSTTALHAHRILGTALEAARRNELIIRNVSTLVEAPRAEAKKPPLFSGDEAVAILRTANNGTDASRWWAALLFGSRQGECLGLRWSSVDLDTGTVDIEWSLSRVPYRHGCARRAPWPCGHRWGAGCPDRVLKIPAGFAYVHLTGNMYLLCPKNGKPRRLLLIPAMTAALRLHRDLTADEPNPHGLVWHRPNGMPIDPRADWEAWNALLVRAGLSRGRLHEARHVTATLLMELGVPTTVAETITGHSSAAQLLDYQYSSDPQQLAALTALGERLQLV